MSPTQGEQGEADDAEDAADATDATDAADASVSGDAGDAGGLYSMPQGDLQGGAVPPWRILPDARVWLEEEGTSQHHVFLVRGKLISIARKHPKVIISGEKAHICRGS